MSVLCGLSQKNLATAKKMVSLGIDSHVLGRCQAKYSSWDCKLFSAESVLLETS